jgi:hypothetical protein
LCGLWLNSYTSKQYSEISDFYLYEGGNL